MKYTAALLLGAALAFLSACNGEAERMAQRIAGGGDPSPGQRAISRYGCASCHTIPGIARADGLVGPPLSRIGSRTYIAGVLINTPENMVRWIQDPPEIDPLTAMPKLGVSDEDARDIVSYLYTLR